MEHIPVTEASARGIARLAKDAEAGQPVIITRHGKPVAAVVPIEAGEPVDVATPINRETSQAHSNRRSATDRWVQAVAGSARRVPGPPAGG